jgi:Transposase DDE domain group 1
MELAIRDLKAGAGLRHCPSGRFLANAAWLVITTLAHNQLRWIAALGLQHRGLVAAKTLRCRLVALPGRLTRSARRCQLHLASGWPWASDFTQALGRLRALTTSPPQPPVGILR